MAPTIRTVLSLLALAVLAHVDPSTAHADDDQAERILDFHTDIAVGRTGRLDVRETIQVVARGRMIVHGIVRDLSSTDRGYGNHMGTEYDVRGTWLDGAPVPFASTLDGSDGISLWIGDPYRRLSSGEHVYVIHYRTSPRVYRDRTADRLTWNLTSDIYSFPIERASMCVWTATGAIGARYSAISSSGTVIPLSRTSTAEQPRLRLSTQRRVEPNTSVIVYLAFPSGTVRELPTSEWLGDMFRYTELDAIPLGALIILFVVLAGKVAVSRRPIGEAQRASIVGPPAGISAPAARYLRQFTFDDRVFTSGILELVNRGYATLRSEPGGFTLERTWKTEAECKLLDAEVEMATALFAGEPSFVIGTAARGTLSAGSLALRRNLRILLVPEYFEPGSSTVTGSILWMLFALVVYCVAAPNTSVALFLLISVLGFTGGAVSGVSSLIRLRASDGWLGRSAGMALILSIAGTAVALFFAVVASRVAALSLVGSFILIAIFDAFLDVPTQLGADTRAEIDAFRSRLESDVGETVVDDDSDPVASVALPRLASYAFALDVSLKSPSASEVASLHRALCDAMVPPRSSSRRSNQGSYRSSSGSRGGRGGGW